MDGGVGAGVGQAGSECLVRGVPEPQVQPRCARRLFRLLCGVAVGGEFAGDGAGPVRHVQHPRTLGDGCVRVGPYSLLHPHQQGTGGGQGDPLGQPRPPRDPRQLGDEFRGVRECVRQVPAGVGEQPLSGAVVGEDRGEGDGLRVGDRVPHQQPPPARISPRRSGPAFPARPLLLLGPPLRPPGDGHGMGDFERRDRVRPMAQQVSVLPVCREQFRQPGQIDLLSVSTGAPSTQWVPSIQRRWRGQMRVCGFRYSRAGLVRPVRAAVHSRQPSPAAGTTLPKRNRPAAPPPVRREGLLSGPGGQGPSQDVLGHAAEHRYAGPGFGVEIHLAVRPIPLEQASADLEECWDEVSDAEPVAVGQPVQVRQVRLALQWREPYRPRSCRRRTRRLRRGGRESRMRGQMSFLADPDVSPSGQWPNGGVGWTVDADAAGQGWRCAGVRWGCGFRARCSAAVSSSICSSSFLVIFSVPSRRETRAASRMRWERLPMRPLVRAWR